MKRVVVTGATSMIGVALIKACIEKGVSVLAIVRKNSNRSERLPKSNLIKIVYADLEELEFTEFEEETYDVFYHFAWVGTTREIRNNPKLQQDNIRTTLCAVEMAHKFGCKKFIGAGSQAEFGPIDGVISEESSVNPNTAYGIAKYAANMLSRKLCEQYGIVHIWGRIFSVYGCNDNEGTMISYAVNQIKNDEIAKFSAATQMWNYLFEDDAGMMFYLLGKGDVEGGTYCIAHDKSQILKEYICTLNDICGGVCQFAPDTGEKLMGLCVDTSKLTKAIEYLPQVTFEDGIKRIWETRR